MTSPKRPDSDDNNPLTVEELLPDLPDYDPDPADGVRVGESPVPGLTLKRILRGHRNTIFHTEWSPNGRYLASASSDKSIRIWDVINSKCVAILNKNNFRFYDLTWSPDGRFLASCSYESDIFIWETSNWEIVAELESVENSGPLITWSPDGKRIVRVSTLGSGIMYIWDIDVINDKEMILQNLIILEAEGSGSGSGSMISDLIWSPDGKKLAFTNHLNDTNIEIWDIQKSYQEAILEHSTGSHAIAWHPNHSFLATGAMGNGVINLWSAQTYKLVQQLEAHTGNIKELSYSKDGSLLASKGDDGIYLWRTDKWQVISMLHESAHNDLSAGQTVFNPKVSSLVTFGEDDTAIRIWEIDKDVLLSENVSDSVKYTTAKVVLVGDSGVGKTGLGWRLAHGEFKEHASTHGQQFWVVDELGTTHEDGTQCEAVLWDLAGQHVYRQIHSIFLDDVDASLVLFDPTNRQNFLKGAEFWLEQLKGTGDLPPGVLVGARMDRGGATESEEYLQQFCQQHGISGGYIGTSAKEDTGLDDLMDILKQQIPWDEMTTTVTTVTFKRIKDYVLALKEQPDRQNVLVTPHELRQQLQDTDSDWDFTDAEMMTAVGHLQTHGYVTILKSSSGETHILLTPDLLVSLASSIVLLADKHPRELGAVSEPDLLEDRHQFEELEGLNTDERHILLSAAVLRFLEHNICFRGTLDSDTLLIFPGLIKQRRPLAEDFEAVDDVSYVVRGRVENIYAMLVVLLGYTPSFLRINQWQNQAQYVMGHSGICGFRLIEDREGEIELVLYYSKNMPGFGRQDFQKLFESFLYQHQVMVTRFPPVICEEGHPIVRATVVSRLREGKSFAFCAECGDKVDLPELEKADNGFASPDWLQGEEAVARLRSSYEMHLSRIKDYRRDWATPRCYLSFTSEQAEDAKKLSRDLKDAGVLIIEDATQVENDDYLIVLDTNAYQKAYRNPSPDFATDTELLKSRLSNGNHRLVSLKFDGASGGHPLQYCEASDFSNSTHYPVSLFNLVLNLYAIPLTHIGFEPLRQSLHRQWESTLSTLAPEEEETGMKALKIFISYAHKDETFKDELDTMLGSMQRRKLIDVWHDRRIEPGEEWFKAIQTAMNDCDMALLLISENFLNSRFIQEEEIPHLLERRIEEGMQVIPIIVNHCMWDSEPVIKDLQALPKDAEPVITFTKENGDRSKVWRDIAKVIETRAKETQDGK